MLRLNNISKDYVSGDSVVHALKGVDIEFRKSEFVAVLGPSGCGKTTLLNIIGGLDRYTSGELSINGRPTADFSDADWDAYRNHSIGFVFQSYNLIPHQTVLSNVELALTLSGVSKSERRRRAKEALERVGLGDQLSKKPNQMSGGQMQRVAIARALVNDPEILLADEPTGALDSENSVQIMEILKEISSDRLIIMVTHNPDLAEQYATRIVRLLDGEIQSDTDPVKKEDMTQHAEPRTKAQRKEDKKKHTSMSFLTALSLSCNNLLTKKTRTFLTSFAGSIGIIGIALILSLSNGISLYIDQVQEDTLSSYPIALQAESVDIGSLFNRTAEGGSDNAPKTDEELGEYVYANNMMYDFINALNSVEMTKNNLSAFKTYIETEKDGERPLDDYASSIMYEYDVPLNIYVKDKDGKIVRADATAMMQNMMTDAGGGSSDIMSSMFANSSMTSQMMSGVNVWDELLPPDSNGKDEGLVSPLLREQYDLLYGEWPDSYDEVILVVDYNNRLSDLVLYSLGLITSQEMSDSFVAMQNGEEIHNDNGPWSFEDMCSRTMRLVISADKYAEDPASGAYVDMTETELGLSTVFEKGVELKISGIVRPNPDAVSTAIAGSIGYTTALTDYIIDETATRDIVKAQLADPAVDVITSLPFPVEDEEEPDEAEIKSAVDEYIKTLSVSERAAIYVELVSSPTDEYVNGAVEQYMATLDRAAVEEMIKTEYPEYASMLADMSDETLFGYVRESVEERVRSEYAAGVEEQLGALPVDTLSEMLDTLEMTAEHYALIYENHVPRQVSESTYEDNLDLLGIVDRDSPSAIYIYAATFADKDAISGVIGDYNDSVGEGDEITYTDYVALLMSSITTILNAITYVLIAFVAVSLVVSSIMIGIITYISVLERTKEIGILRSIGASKRDVSRVFNAETLIVGFASGMIGILSTLLLCIPINIIIRALTDIQNIGAVLPWQGAVILVIISMSLTLIAGLIPAKLAAKKDPVVALRTE